MLYLSRLGILRLEYVDFAEWPGAKARDWPAFQAFATTPVAKIGML